MGGKPVQPVASQPTLTAWSDALLVRTSTPRSPIDFSRFVTGIGLRIGHDPA